MFSVIALFLPANLNFMCKHILVHNMLCCCRREALGNTCRKLKNCHDYFIEIASIRINNLFQLQKKLFNFNCQVIHKDPSIKFPPVNINVFCTKETPIKIAEPFPTASSIH